MQLRTLGKCRFRPSGGFVKPKISQGETPPLKPLPQYDVQDHASVARILALSKNRPPRAYFYSAWYGTDMPKAYTNNINLFQKIILKIGAPFSALAPGRRNL